MTKVTSLEKTLESNNKELEKVTTKVQNLESKISKEIHEKTALQADKAALMTELKDELVKSTTLAKEVQVYRLVLSFVFTQFINRWKRTPRSTRPVTRKLMHYTSI